MLFLPDTLSATYWLCLLNDKEGVQIDPQYHWAFNQWQVWILDAYTRMDLGLVCVRGEQRDWRLWAEISKELSFRYAVISYLSDNMRAIALWPEGAEICWSLITGGYGKLCQTPPINLQQRRLFDLGASSCWIQLQHLLLTEAEPRW